MTPEQLWKLAFRTCEAKIRKTGPVFSEAEIMAEFPGVGLVGDQGYPGDPLVSLVVRLTREFSQLKDLTCPTK